VGCFQKPLSGKSPASDPVTRQQNMCMQDQGSEPTALKGTVPLGLYLLLHSNEGRAPCPCPERPLVRLRNIQHPCLRRA
jgi:hypothetical protein